MPRNDTVGTKILMYIARDNFEVSDDSEMAISSPKI
jgi:hypothetical protein